MESNINILQLFFISVYILCIVQCIYVSVCSIVFCIAFSVVNRLNVNFSFGYLYWGGFSLSHRA